VQFQVDIKKDVRATVPRKINGFFVKEIFVANTISEELTEQSYSQKFDIPNIPLEFFKKD